MDSNSKQTQNKLEQRSSNESRKIWNLEQKELPIVDVGSINSVNPRFVNDYPNGQNLTLRDNAGTLYNVVIADGKLLKGSSTFTEI